VVLEQETAVFSSRLNSPRLSHYRIVLRATSSTDVIQQLPTIGRQKVLCERHIRVGRVGSAHADVGDELAEVCQIH